MELIPAIDIIDGKCVRLKQGRFEEKTIFNDDPVAIAKRWEAEGAGRIHLVDLEGSRQGRPIELNTLKRIRSAVNIPLQLGGGVRKEEDIINILNAGADRVILGTSVALDTNFAAYILNKYADKIIIGIDAKDGFVAVSGWEQVTAKKAVEFAGEMETLGARRIIYTDISRDGMMVGANVSAMEIMANSVGIPVIASGGVSSYDDINKLRDLGVIEGAIIGKALYTGDISLVEANQWK